MCVSLRAVFTSKIEQTIRYPILNMLHTISTLMTHDVTNHFEAFCVVLPMHLSIASMMAVACFWHLLSFRCGAAVALVAIDPVLMRLVRLYGMRERSRSQIMVMECGILIGLPVA